MNPFPGRLQREEFSEALHVLKEEIRGMEKRDHADKSDLKSPIFHYKVCEQSAAQLNLQRCNMPTFLSKERGERRMTEEEISLLIFQTLEGIK